MSLFGLSRGDEAGYLRSRVDNETVLAPIPYGQVRRGMRIPGGAVP